MSGSRCRTLYDIRESGKRICAIPKEKKKEKKKKINAEIANSRYLTEPIPEPA